jgi:hypothetical protein
MSNNPNTLPAAFIEELIKTSKGESYFDNQSDGPELEEVVDDAEDAFSLGYSSGKVEYARTLLKLLGISYE